MAHAANCVCAADVDAISSRMKSSVRQDLRWIFTGCGVLVQVKDRDVNHRGQVGAACQELDQTRLKLNTNSSLIAPVVVLSHDRPEYLGKTLMTLLKWVLGVCAINTCAAVPLQTEPTALCA